MKKPLFFLLIDDDIEDTFIFKEVLESMESQINFQNAKDGLEALQLLKDSVELPDTIFLDLNMPRMNGKECLAKLKSDPHLKQVPVIIYTTSLQSSDIEETLQKGATCFIAKPTSIKDLKKILSFIAENLYNNFEKKLNAVSDSFNTFIVC